LIGELTTVNNGQQSSRRENDAYEVEIVDYH